MKFGKFNASLLEGMACQGGCIAGPASIEPPMVIRGRMVKENSANKKTISESVETFDFSDVAMHRE